MMMLLLFIHSQSLAAVDIKPSSPAPQNGPPAAMPTCSLLELMISPGWRTARLAGR